MKYLNRVGLRLLEAVAPRAGAWVEIPERPQPADAHGRSLPVRERGLKYSILCVQLGVLAVAPRAGAWVEIVICLLLRSAAKVAPRAGAWVEIMARVNGRCHCKSLPVRERGLKSGLDDPSGFTVESLPVRERGLK